MLIAGVLFRLFVHNYHIILAIWQCELRLRKNIKYEGFTMHSMSSARIPCPMKNVLFRNFAERHICF